MTANEERTADYLGLLTDRYQHYSTIGQQVRWIAWDSPASALAMGDVITEVRANGSAIDRAALPYLQYPPGGTSALWGALRVKPGTPLALRVQRGDAEHEIELQAVPQQFYKTDDGKRSLFPSGPYSSGRTPAGENWSLWYERIIKAWSRVLCDGWRQRSFDTRRLLAEHHDEHEVVAFLKEQHPGAFADHIDARWNDVKEKLEGAAWPAETIDLSYREAAKERREQIKAAGNDAHAAFEKAVSESLTDAFPAPDPYEAEPGSVAGRLVMIDRVSPRNMRNDGVRAWYILGDKYKGWYFLDVYSPAVKRMWDVIDDYHRQVTPHLAESYRFYLRLTEEPMMRARERRNVALGFKTQLVAAWIGRELFISDLDFEAPAMAGAELLQGSAMDPPADDASPRELAMQRIEAVKRLRRDRWRALFADWKVSRDFASEPIFLPYGDYGPSDKRTGWEQSQKRLFSDVFDVKVLAHSEVHTVLPANSAEGTPLVEECEVIVEHVGNEESQYRSFKDSWLTRVWRLQRVDGGPWRFVFPRAL
ncbi:MAG: hypothetical protein AAFN78_20150 [Pseudomonadota bacterium]